MGVAEPGVRPPGAASPSAKSISGRRNSSRSNGIGRMRKFSENTSTIPEVMGSSTLNFNPNFSHDFFGGTPVPLPVCTSKSWSISSVCKNSRAQHPLRAEI